MMSSGFRRKAPLATRLGLFLRRALVFRISIKVTHDRPNIGLVSFCSKCLFYLYELADNHPKLAVDLFESSVDLAEFGVDLPESIIDLLKLRPQELDELLIAVFVGVLHGFSSMTD